LNNLFFYFSSPLPYRLLSPNSLCPRTWTAASPFFTSILSKEKPVEPNVSNFPEQEIKVSCWTEEKFDILVIIKT
jgi:hypothetical protein